MSYIENGTVFDDVPVSAALKVVRQDELLEDSEDVIEWNEVQRLVFLQDFEPLLLAIPQRQKGGVDFRQLEVEGGHVTDVSAFNTNDFARLCGSDSFDEFRYMADKAAEQARELAILHSCVSDAAGRVRVRERFVAFVEGKFGGYARRLAECIERADDEVVRAELISKLRKQQREVARLWSVWQEFAYNW